MSKIYKNITELIGNTPIIELSGYGKDLNGRLLAKLEYLNPAGSAKDRIALAMINDAEEKGLLKPGSAIIEPTSGNTGIGLCSVAASRGYRAIIVMPDTMSVERRLLMSAYGAEVVLTDGKLGMNGAVEKAKELSKSIPGSFIPDQFNNPANADAHFKTMGPEIWDALDGKIDFFVASIGTGGTITGTGRFLKSQNPDIKVVGVEPFESPLITKGVSGPHKIQGIGANFIPGVLDLSVIDEVVCVKGDDAYEESRALAKTEGFLAGISSGAVLSAAREILRKNPGKTVIALLTDGGERYLSSGLFE